MNQLFFLKTFLHDYRVAAVLPTTSGAVRKICARLDLDRPVKILEYGPGEGVFTRYLLTRLNAESQLVAVDTSADFVARLGQLGDPRLSLIQGDVRNIQALLAARGFEKFDYVISGIPFTFLKETERMTVAKMTADLLGPGGSFLVYQYSLLMRRYLARAFPRVRVSVVPLNLPPTFVMEGFK